MTTDLSLSQSGAPSPTAEQPSPAQFPSSGPAPPAAMVTPQGFYTFILYPPGVSPAIPAQAAPAPAAAAARVVTGIPPVVPPTGPLSPVEDITPAPEWYMIACGRFVGVVDQYAMAHWAVRGISSPIHKAYTSQVFALDAFNKVVDWGGVEVVRSNNW
ncbi:hypothetical protein C8R43DRAFT_963140 [Mycena crocata]|nr:hypothetical protein C8R43DRAFT_963140 [Mycena crocata]